MPVSKHWSLCPHSSGPTGAALRVQLQSRSSSGHEGGRRKLPRETGPWFGRAQQTAPVRGPGPQRAPPPPTTPTPHVPRSGSKGPAPRLPGNGLPRRGATGRNAWGKAVGRRPSAAEMSPGESRAGALSLEGEPWEVDG